MPGTKAKYGGYGGVFEAIFSKALQQQNKPESSLKITKWDVVNAQKYPEVDSIDAILMTGGRTISCKPQI